MYACVYLCVYVCMNVCMYVCMLSFIYLCVVLQLKARREAKLKAQHAAANNWKEDLKYDCFSITLAGRQPYIYYTYVPLLVQSVVDLYSLKDLLIQHHFTSTPYSSDSYCMI